MDTLLRRPWARAALVLALPALLTGCRAAYDVQVRNLTDQPIGMALTAPFGDGADAALASGRLGPGDRGTLFKQVDAGTRVALRVDFAGNEGYPAVLDLSRGETVVNVRRVEGDGAGSKGRLRLEEIPRP